ncbi:MAG: cytochrome c [Ghiorsea sp.]|nr:cytochrome c [Ghiorsea sp.]
MYFTKITLFIFVFSGFVFSVQAADVEETKAVASTVQIGDIQKGKVVFDRLCIHCHKSNYDEKFGPGLAGIVERRDKQWLHAFLKKPNQMIKDDEYAKNLKENNAYNLTMPAFPEMQNKQDREDMIAYLATLSE